MAIDTGEGSTLTYSGLTYNILRFGGPSVERAAIKTSHLGTTGYHTYIPSTLVEGGTVDMTVQYDAAIAPPITGAAGAVAITIGDVAIGCSFTGFLQSFNPTVEGEALNTADCSIKVASTITWDVTP